MRSSPLLLIHPANAEKIDGAKSIKATGVFTTLFFIKYRIRRSAMNRYRIHSDI
jgi:hypothetical protein